MSCGFKHNGILFRNRKELVDYMSTGKKPDTDIVLAQAKNSVVKKLLGLSDAKTAIAGLVKMFPGFTTEDINLINTSVGNINRVGPLYYNFIEKGDDKDGLKDVYSKLSEYIADLVNVSSLYNEDSDEPINVSPSVLSFTQKISNENIRNGNPAIGPTEPSSSGVFEKPENKWFIPERENNEGGQTAEADSETESGETQGEFTSEGSSERRNRPENRGKLTSGSDNGSGGFQDGSRNFKSERDTVRNGGSFEWRPERVRIESGDYVAWSNTGREFTNIVRQNGNRWGIVRPANAVEKQQASKVLKDMYYQSDSVYVGEPESDSGSIVGKGRGLSIESLNAIDAEVQSILSNPSFQDQINTIFENTGAYYRNGGIYFPHKGKEVFNAKNSRHTFSAKGKTSVTGRDAVLKIKKPIVKGTADYNWFEKEAKEKGVDFADHILDKGYDSIVTDKTITVLNDEAVIFPEEFPAYIVDMYAEDKRNGVDSELVYNLESAFRRSAGIEEESDQIVSDEEVRTFYENTENDLKKNRLEAMVMDGEPMSNISTLVKQGFLEMSPAELYSFIPGLKSRGISYEDVVGAMGVDMFPVLDDSMKSATGIENYEMLPSVIVDPASLYRSMGFSPAHSELFEKIYATIPYGYNKTKTALKIGLELFYPEKTGLGILNYIPLSKDERYAIEEMYGDVEGKLQDVYLDRLISEGEKPFWVNRGFIQVGSYASMAKEMGFKLPMQYENIHKFFRTKNPLYDLGDVLVSESGRYSVFNVDYSNTDNLTYTLRNVKDDSFIGVDSIGLDGFRKVVEFEKPELEEARTKVTKALSEIGTKIEVKNPLDFYSPLSGKKEIKANYDILNNVLNISADDKDAISIYHEAAHAVFIRGIRINKDDIISLHNQIASVLANGNEKERMLHDVINDIMALYTVEDANGAKMGLDELIAHEYLAQLVSYLSQYERDIQPQTAKSIIDRIIQWFREKLGWKQPMSLNNISDVIGFINGIAGKLRTGEIINFQDYKTMFSDEKIIESGTLFSKEIGVGLLKPGVRYPVVGTDGKLSMKTVYITGEVNGVSFVQFEGDGTRYFSNDVVVSPVKGSDKLGIVLKQNASAYQGRKPRGVSEKTRSDLRKDLLYMDSDGNFVFTPAQVYRKYQEQGLLEDMTYSEFIMISDAIRGQVVENAANQPEPPLDEDMIPANPAPNSRSNRPIDPTFENPDDSLESLIKRINNFDINEGTIQRWMDSNKGPEYLTDFSELGDYMSGDTIERKTGEAPTNDQTYIKFEIAKGAEIAAGILADLKAIYPGDTYVQKTLELLNSRSNSVVGTALMYAALERDLIARKYEELDNHRNLTKLQKIVHERSQANIRNVSVALNARKTSYMMLEGSVTPTDIENMVLPKEYVKKKNSLVDAVQNGDVNEVADEATVSTSTKKQKPVRKKTSVSEWETKIKPADFISKKLADLKNLISKIC